MGTMTLQTAQLGAHIGEYFWIKWVLANAVGFALGAAVSSVPDQAIVWLVHCSDWMP